MSITGVMNSVPPSTVKGPTREQLEVQVKLLDKAQDLAAEQANTLIESLETISPTDQHGLNVYA